MVMELKATKRETRGRRAAERRRREGFTPAIVYMHGDDALSLEISTHDFHAVMRNGEHVVDLAIEGEDDRKAIIQEVEWDCLGDIPMHVDFHSFEANDRIRIGVQLKLAGIPIGEKSGGQTVVSTHEIEVLCSPSDIEESLRIDISGIELGTALHVSELTLPDAWELSSSGDAVVVSVVAPRGESEEEEVVEGEEGAEEGAEATTEEE